MAELFTSEYVSGEIGLITDENIGIFKSLLLPDAAEAIKNKEPVLALGWGVDGVAAGALSGVITNNSSFSLTSLYVAPDYRNFGGASFLLDTLEELLRGHAADISVDFLCTNDDHILLERYLRSEGFTDSSGEVTEVYMTGLREAVENIPSGRLGFADRSVGTPFSDMNERTLRQVEKDADVNNEPLPLGGLLSPDVDKKLSYFYGEDKKYAFIVVEKDESGALTVTSAVNRSGKPLIFGRMLGPVFKAASENYPPETPLYIPSINPTSKQIVENLLPTAKKINVSLQRPLRS